MNKKQIVVPVVLTLLVLGALLLSKSKQVTVNPNQTPGGGIAVTPEPSTMPEANSGIYTDQKNHFTVTYPKTFKTYPTFETTDTSGLALDILDQKGVKTHWLNISSSTAQSTLNDYNSYANSPFNQPLINPSSYESKSKDEWPLWNKTRLADITVKGNQGVVVYTYPTEGGSGERSWGYSTYFKVGNKIINISIFSSLGKAELDTQKQTYNNIVASFKNS